MSVNERLPSLPLLLDLLALRDKALAADSLNALAFAMANDLYPLLHYRQAVVLARRDKRFELLAISGLAKPAEDSPYLIWLRRTCPWLSARLPDDAPRWLAREELQPPPEIDDGWAEWWPAGVFCVPIADRDDQPLGLLLFLLDAPPTEPQAAALKGLWQTWAYCWAALAGRRRVVGWRPSRRQVLVVLGACAALLFLPVRQTALAPAEIVSHRAQVISSPIDGVIERMLVRPNQPVEVGTPLFALDETSLRSRAEVLGKEVAVADAELVAASQRAFDNPQSKNELTLLSSRAQQRRAELAAVQAQLKRALVTAPRAGVAVFSDPNDWIGKPVVTGERILLVADPTQPAMRIQLPVADAIGLEPGAQVTLFLTAHPLVPLHGEVLETSYQARPSDEGVASYQLLASIEGQPEQARLGLQGTAKLYGGRVVLGYYLLRRPLSTLRAWTGW
ncbi:efflux RND transporter periplasmic adaptor subunit [Zestomonas carbonaria]|uniref:Uncharacterized protein n=1 Tax=Zestomonas carbonaria TaxID=2762745 RepID=A0A7U7EIT5_9GAMM|nr:HlyD family efflux transporter periplasmic adaptor subunit [Pseudomonas carbonaria]CAD5105839.1 hypothetical protein PSEWESI4_00096 [Pseudomonas carbonaria]